MSANGLPSAPEEAPGLDLAARLLYRDGLVLVIDKPAGIPVHKARGRGPNLEEHFDALRFGLPGPPRLAHRLDKETSGCLVLGRHAEALRRLGRLFEQGLVEKTYWAVTEGVPEAAEGRIALALGKASPDPRSWRMRVDERGQEAVTDYRVLAAKDGRALLALFPRTGRTHQLRVHLAAIGTPILGDAVYGRGGAPGLCLHARAVRLPLHAKRPAIAVEAPPPGAFRAAAEPIAGDLSALP